MPLHRLNDLSPQLGEGAWAAPSADLIGDVLLGARAIGHSDPGFPLTIGARVTVGHQAILHGCTVRDDCLIGMGAKILNGATIESDCLVGAGALVTEGKTFPTGSLIVGVPARVLRPLSDEEKQALRVSAAHYAEKAARYAAQLRAVGSNV